MREREREREDVLVSHVMYVIRRNKSPTCDMAFGIASRVFNQAIGDHAKAFTRDEGR